MDTGIFDSLPCEMLLYIITFLGTIDTVNFLTALQPNISIEELVNRLTSKRHTKFDHDTEDEHLTFFISHASKTTFSTSSLHFAHCKLLSYNILSTYMKRCTKNLTTISLRNCVSRELPSLILTCPLQQMDLSFNPISSDQFKSFLIKNKNNLKRLSYLSLAGCGKDVPYSETDRKVSTLTCNHLVSYFF